jgi:hypothetical protein
LEYNVPSNGTCRRSYGGEFLREMHEGQQAGRRGGKSKVTITARRVGRRSCGAKAAVRRNELGGASMQPSTATLPTNSFVNHRISSSPSSSYRCQSYSPREFTFRVSFFITKATPRFALIHWIFLIPAIPLPEYRHYFPVIYFPGPGTWLLCFRKF